MNEIDENNLQQINDLLQMNDCFDHEIVSVTKLLSGNMNLTLRCITKNNDSVILKQGRDFVEKYPSIAAPVGRTSVEYYYYKQIARDEYLSVMSPKVLGICHENQILVLEDLGHGSDGINYYQDPSSLPTDYLLKMIDYLSRLHLQKRPDNDRLLENKKMRELNSFHMFDFPFTPDGHDSLIANFPELKELSDSVIKNETVKSVASKLKDCYLDDGEHLIHGDFYLGSLFLVEDHVYVIDPEFCFWGHREFDLGIFLAHLLMLNKSRGECTSLINHYLEDQTDIDLNLLNQHAGIEILRRIYGVAQLPFAGELTTLEHKTQLTDLALGLL